MGDWTMCAACRCQVLTDELPGLVGSLSFKKSMRWNPGGAGSGSVAFSRPMRWLLAMHGDTVLPFVYGALQVGHASNARKPRQASGRHGNAAGRLCLVRAEPGCDANVLRGAA